jgi:hypothetical protein
MAVCDDVTPGACDAVFIISMILLSLIASIGVWKFLISPCITNCFILSKELDMTKDQRLERIENREARAAKDAADDEARLKYYSDTILKLEQRHANREGVPILQYPNQCYGL